MSLIDGIYWEQRMKEEDERRIKNMEKETIKKKALVSSLCTDCKIREICKARDNMDELQVKLHEYINVKGVPAKVALTCNFRQKEEEKSLEELEREIPVLETMYDKNMKSKMEEIAYKIKDLLVKHDCWFDVSIYFNNCRMSSGSDKLEFDIDVTKYLEYSNPETLSMSFEGPLYHYMNYGGNRELLDELDALLKQYGYYYELGYAYSLSIYEI